MGYEPVQMQLSRYPAAARRSHSTPRLLARHIFKSGCCCHRGWMIICHPSRPALAGGLPLPLITSNSHCERSRAGPCPRTYRTSIQTTIPVVYILVPTARQFENEVWCMFQAIPLLEHHHMAAMGGRGHARAPPEHAQPPPTPAAESNGF